MSIPRPQSLLRSWMLSRKQSQAAISVTPKASSDELLADEY
jgi:hypothetical protein